MNGRSSKRPVKIKVPEISEKTAESRFARRYSIAVNEVLDRALMPALSQIQASISRQIQRKKPKNRSEIDAIADKEVENYIRKNPNTFASLYLQKYGLPYRHEGTEYLGKMSISIYRDLAQHHLMEASLDLRDSGKPFHPDNIWQILRPGSEQKSTYFVDHNSLEGAFAIQIAKYLDRFLRKPINEFKYSMSRPKEEKHPVEMHIRTGKENEKRSTITFSRT